MSALRQRLIEDLRIRNYSPRTVQAYVAAVKKLTRHFGRAPDLVTGEELRAFQVHLLARRTSWSQFNQIVSGLRFFFGTTLCRPDVVPMLPYGKRPKRLPSVLSVEEVTQLLQAARPGLERILLQTAYGCGLRLSELVSLQVTDIDATRMVVIVRQGKGQKDRQVPLSARLLAELRQWDWVVYAKPPFGGPQQVLKYLARYTHRVAISNRRLLSLTDGEVTFRYKDYRDASQHKLLTLSAEEFLRRFVQHVLPKGFMKIRHYGLLASRHRQARLTRARQLLLPLTATQGLSTVTTIEPAEVARCPQCGSVRRVRVELPPDTAPFAADPSTNARLLPTGDTS